MSDHSGIWSEYLSFPLFFAKKEISFEGTIFGGSLFSGGGVPTFGICH